MKAIMTRTGLYPAMAVMMLAAALAVPAAAEQEPFTGAMQGDDADIAATSTSVTVLTQGKGLGTLLGQFIFTQTVTVDFATGNDTGSAQWIAANGDSITTKIAGSGKMVETGLFWIEDVHTITAGTGRFAGAQGTFTVRRLASGVTFLTSGSFDGTITSPGGAR